MTDQSGSSEQAAPLSTEVRRRAVLAGGAMLLSVGASAPRLMPPEAMLTPGEGFRPYGERASQEGAIKRILTPLDGYELTGTSRTPLEQLEGALTPSALHFERHHNGVPQIDPAVHRLFIHGMVERPLSFSLATLRRYPMSTNMRFIECGGNSSYNTRPDPPQLSAGTIHGLLSSSEWTGVPLRLLLEEAGIKAGAAWVIAEGGDASALSRSVPLDKCMDDAVVALFQNGEALRPEQGYPIRLLLPGFEGNMQVKWLHRLKVVAKPLQSREETAHYTELMPDGKARQFVLQVPVKSVILKPSYGLTLPGPGAYEISGLCWSGAGRVSKVDVSTDGGSTWQPAHLDGPAPDKAAMRFRLGWRWDGSPATLLSRATDEAGDVQPARSDWIRRYAPGQPYHNNSMQAWRIAADGAVTNVYA